MHANTCLMNRHTSTQKHFCLLAYMLLSFPWRRNMLKYHQKLKINDKTHFNFSVIEIRKYQAKMRTMGKEHHFQGKLNIELYMDFEWKKTIEPYVIAVIFLVQESLYGFCLFKSKLTIGI